MSAPRPPCQCDGSGWLYYTAEWGYGKDGCERCAHISDLEGQLRDMRAVGNHAAVERLSKALDEAYKGDTP